MPAGGSGKMRQTPACPPKLRPCPPRPSTASAFLCCPGSFIRLEELPTKPGALISVQLVTLQGWAISGPPVPVVLGKSCRDICRLAVQQCLCT